MRVPSIKKLTERLNLTRKQAKLVRALGRAVDDPEELARLVEEHVPATAGYVRSMHSSPYDSHLWRVTVALNAMNNVLGTYGVEPLGPQGSSSEGYAPSYEYLNTGDIYGTTLIYRRKTDTLSVGDWGSIAEAHPSWE